MNKHFLVTFLFFMTVSCSGSHYRVKPDASLSSHPFPVYISVRNEGVFEILTRDNNSEQGSIADIESAINLKEKLAEALIKSLGEHSDIDIKIIHHDELNKLRSDSITVPAFFGTRTFPIYEMQILKKQFGNRGAIVEILIYQKLIHFYPGAPSLVELAMAIDAQIYLLSKGKKEGSKILIERGRIAKLDKYLRDNKVFSREQLNIVAGKLSKSIRNEYLKRILIRKNKEVKEQ